MRALLAVVIALGIAGGAALFLRRRPPPPPPPPPAAPPRPVVEPLPAPREGFAGRWVGPCSLTTKCPGEPQSVDEDQLDIAIAASDTTLEVTREGCRYLFDVRRKSSGSTAVARPGQRCAGGADVESWTLALQAADQELVATMTTRTSAAPGVSCVSRMRGVLVRR